MTRLSEPLRGAHPSRLCLMGGCGRSSGLGWSPSRGTHQRTGAPVARCGWPVLLLLLVAPLAHAVTYTTTKCDPGWTKAQHGVCYRRLGAAVSFWTAQTQCADMGGKVAVIRDAAQNSLVNSLCDNIGGTTNCWIGYSDAINSANGYRWFGGSDGFSFTDTAAGAPAGADDTRVAGASLSGWGYGEARAGLYLPLCEKPGAYARMHWAVGCSGCLRATYRVLIRTPNCVHARLSDRDCGWRGGTPRNCVLLNRRLHSDGVVHGLPQRWGYGRVCNPDDAGAAHRRCGRSQLRHGACIRLGCCW